MLYHIAVLLQNFSDSEKVNTPCGISAFLSGPSAWWEGIPGPAPTLP